MNDALGTFVNEMKNQQVWNNVAIVMGSEFGKIQLYCCKYFLFVCLFDIDQQLILSSPLPTGRRIPANSGNGNDHGWGGHYFIMGGNVNGGKIHGQYPHPLNNLHSQYVYGRVIPTSPFECKITFE